MRYSLSDFLTEFSLNDRTLYIGIGSNRRYPEVEAEETIREQINISPSNDGLCAGVLVDPKFPKLQTPTGLRQDWQVKRPGRLYTHKVEDFPIAVFSCRMDQLDFSNVPQRWIIQFIEFDIVCKNYGRKGGISECLYYSTFLYIIILPYKSYY